MLKYRNTRRNIQRKVLEAHNSIKSSNQEEISGCKEIGIVYAIVAKETKEQVDTNPISAPEEIKKLLTDFSDVEPEVLPSELPPLRSIQHAIDFIPGSQ